MSFQFSFLAVFAVIISSDVIKTEKQITIKSGLSKLMIPFLLQVFTYPLVACYYYELPVYAIFINLLLLPYLGVVMGLGFLGAVLFLCCPFSVSVVWLPVHWILYVYVRVCEFVSALPAHTWIVGKPSGMKVFVYYLLLAGLIALLYAKKEKLYQQFLWQIGGSIALVLLLSISGQRGFEVDFLDVGQGDASYIRSSGGCSMFVDGGSTSTKEVGTYRILPFLTKSAASATPPPLQNTILLKRCFRLSASFPSNQSREPKQGAVRVFILLCARLLSVPPAKACAISLMKIFFLSLA